MIPAHTPGLALFFERASSLGVEHTIGPRESVRAELIRDLMPFRHVAAVGLPLDLAQDLRLSLEGKLLEVPGVPLESLETAEACVTVSEQLVAESGSVVLVSKNLEERRATALPDRLHIFCATPRVFPRVTEFLKASSARFQPKTTVTLVSGPSRTADVEMILVKGVHGPSYIKVYVSTEEGRGRNTA